MSTVALVCLCVIAFASLVQAVFLVGLAFEGLKLARRVTELQEQMTQDIQPAIADLGRVTRNLSEVSEITVAQMRRIDGVLNDAVDTASEARTALAPSFSRVGTVVAAFRGLRRGYAAYRSFRDKR